MICRCTIFHGNLSKADEDLPSENPYYLLDQEIPPGQTVRFNYRPSPPLASREDGQFDVSVKVVGFAQVFPGGAQR
jgi:hypothetical protein